MKLFDLLVTTIHGAAPWIPIWATGLALIVMLCGAVFAAQGIAMRIITYAIAKQNARVSNLFHSARRVIRFGVVLFAISLAIPLLPISSNYQSVAQRSVAAGIILLIGWIIIIVASAAADSYLNNLQLNVTDNLHARKAVTQIRVLKRVFTSVIVVLAIGFALMTFQSVRQFGISIFASAGAAGLIIGLAARPVLTNLIAGVQIALTQPIRIDDAVVLEGEWGWIEELSATYVVVRLWDRRRLIVPLSYFLEKPFQNWTRSSASIIGTVMLYLDHTAPIATIREKLNEIVAKSDLWDRDVVNLQVTDTHDYTIEVRILVSAANSPSAWDLRCKVREEILAYIQQNLPTALPRRRNVAVA